MAETYYDILGVPQSANLEEIKKAYRQRAFESHPDRNHYPGAEERFKRVAEAYFVLSDDKKRATYDQMLANGFFSSGNGAEPDMEEPPTPEGLTERIHDLFMDDRVIELIIIAESPAVSSRLKDDAAGKAVLSASFKNDIDSLCRIAESQAIPEKCRVYAFNVAVTMCVAQRNPGKLVELGLEAAVPAELRKQAQKEALKVCWEHIPGLILFTETDGLDKDLVLEAWERIIALHLAGNALSELRNIAGNSSLDGSVRIKSCTALIGAYSQIGDAPALINLAEDNLLPLDGRIAAGSGAIRMCGADAHKLLELSKNRKLPVSTRNDALDRSIDVTLDSWYQKNYIKGITTVAKGGQHSVPLRHKAWSLLIRIYAKEGATEKLQELGKDKDFPSSLYSSLMEALDSSILKNKEIEMELMVQSGDWQSLVRIAAENRHGRPGSPEHDLHEAADRMVEKALMNSGLVENSLADGKPEILASIAINNVMLPDAVRIMLADATIDYYARVGDWQSLERLAGENCHKPPSSVERRIGGAAEKKIGEARQITRQNDAADMRAKYRGAVRGHESAAQPASVEPAKPVAVAPSKPVRS